MTPMSWILEVRSRLAEPPPWRHGSAGSRLAAMVPLYVDSGELWALFTERVAEEGLGVAFPAALLKSSETWEAALEAAHREAGLDPVRVLRLGELDEVELDDNRWITPCVGAVPPPLPSDREELFGIPLTAFANPQLVEDRVVSVAGEEQVVRLYHVGRRQIWGASATILENLLERLGLELDGDTVA